jgi:tRNA (guanine-N7-)-methyltransferase
VTNHPNSPSRSISSNQRGINKNLEAVVTRHLAHPFRRPFPEHSLRAFDQVENQRIKHGGPLIIDSFCGVGQSTANIAYQHPEALVIGIDRSAHRINKHENEYRNKDLNNYHLVRTDVDDFWRLAVQAGWKPVKHYLLYPNPWPKAAHLKRRCHGSPVFSSLIALGGLVELRSNWQIYVEEFARAIAIAGFDAAVSQFRANDPITPFERKYSLSNQGLWRCICAVE